MSKPKDMTELRDQLLEAFDLLRGDPRRMLQTKELTNTAGKVIGTVLGVATIRFDQGVREAVEHLLARPELQAADPEFDRWCDRVIAAHEAGKEAFQGLDDADRRGRRIGGDIGDAAGLVVDIDPADVEVDRAIEVRLQP